MKALMICLAVVALGTGSVRALDADEEGLLARETMSYATAPVKSDEELTLVANKESALDYFSEGAKKRFLEGITFGKFAVSGMYVGDFHELKATEAYAILKLFGLQDNVHKLKDVQVLDQLDRGLMVQPKDGMNDSFLLEYRCDSAGSCKQNAFYACTSNC
jgi:hypothetical protein